MLRKFLGVDRDHASFPPALVCRSGTWTHQQLLEQCHDVAARIRDGLPETAPIVGIVLTEPAQRVLSLLGTWLAATTAVPIEPAVPRSRLESIAKQAGIASFITDAESEARVLQIGGRSVRFGERTGGPAAEQDYPEPALDAPAILVPVPDPSGTPRIVTRAFRDLWDDVRSASTFLPEDDAETAVVAASASSLHGLIVGLSALSRDRTFYAYDPGSASFEALCELLRGTDSALLEAPTTFFRRFLEDARDAGTLPAVRRAVVNGDRLMKADVENFQRLFPQDCELMNSYGAAEAGFISRHTVTRNLTAPELIPVGETFEGKEVRILDHDGQELPPGKRGEIEVSGANLPPASRTSERSGVPACRVGDMGYIEDGQLVVSGRADNQVKIQDRRVNLAEVELFINRSPGVAETSVMVSEGSSGCRELTAYVTLEPGAVWRSVDLQAQLAEGLPDYMVPRNIVVMGGAAAASDTTGSAGPETGGLSETEEKVAEVWKEVFELDSVAATDDILELGVGSLHAMVMCQKLCQMFSIDIPYSQLVISPTVRELSTYIDEQTSR